VAGETCRDDLDDYFYGFGVRFTQMANLHRRMLRQYCWRASSAAGVREPLRRPRGPFKIWSAPKRP